MIQSLVRKTELERVHPQQMQDRRLKVMNMHFVADDVIAEFVGLSVNDARLDAATGHPDCEGVGVVIAAEEL